MRHIGIDGLARRLSSLSGVPPRANTLLPRPPSIDAENELISRYIQNKSSPRGLDFALGTLRKVSSRPNPAIAAMNDPIMLLTLIVGCKQSPFRFDRADYLHCLNDHGPAALRESLARRCEAFFNNCALMNAVFNDNEDYAIVLAIKHAQIDVSPDIADNAGKTPLMMAAVKAHHDLVQCLLQIGTDPTRVDDAGRNVLHFACMRGNARAFSAALAKMSVAQRATALSQCNAQGLTPREQLALEHDDELLSTCQMSDDGCETFEGRFDAEFSMWPSRSEYDSCDMDRNVSPAKSARTLRDAVVAQRRELQACFDQLVSASP